MILLDPGVAGDGDGMGAEERLAAAGGKAQADVGDVGETSQGRIGPRIAAEAGRLFGRLRDRFLGVSRSGDAGLLEEAAQDGEGVGLVLFELH